MIRSLQKRILCGVGVAFSFLSLASAGTPPDIQILFVTDPVLDRVFRLQDFNQDGDYNDPGETTLFYDSATGPITLTDPTCLTATPNDTVFVGDSTQNIILGLRDNNDDADATDPGEAYLYFDGRPGGNASNVRLTHINGIVLRFLTVVWVANSNTTTGEIDSIIRLEDLNADGDANDAGEAVVFYSPTAAGVTGSVPTAIEIGFDNNIYYTENGTSLPRGVWRLADANHNGVIDPGEATVFYQPPAQANTPAFTSLDVDFAGRWYLGDSANNLVYRMQDANNDGLIAPSEAGVFWTISPTRTFHDLGVKNEGDTVYVPDAVSHTRIFVGIEQDMSNDIDNATETFAAYDDAIAPLNIDNPYGVALDFHTHETVGQEYCTAELGCPCGNNAVGGGTGCANSTGNGASLVGDGTDGIANNDLVFRASNLPPNASALLFSGTSTAGGGFGIPFGDGLRCVSGNVRRLGVHFANSTGFVLFGPGYATQEAWAVGQTLYFQVWYRNFIGPCGQHYNLTNGLQVTFTQ